MQKITVYNVRGSQYDVCQDVLDNIEIHDEITARRGNSVARQGGVQPSPGMISHALD